MAGSGLEVDISVDITNGATVRAHGELDGYSAPKLRAAVHDASLVSPGTLVLDMSGVTFMDSSGLGTLLAMARELQERECQLVVDHPSDRVWKVLEITGTHRQITVTR
jgi:anti-sigma B factor antagonist